MTFRTTLLAATALVALPMTSLAAESDTSKALRFFQQVVNQYAIMVTRSFVDLTYENITIEPGTNDLILSGVKLYPELDWDQNAECEVQIERLVAAGSNSFENAQSMFEISGLSLPAACFDPDLAGMMSSFGYDGLVADTMSVEISYDLPSSAADISMQAAVVDAGDISVSAHFDYFWFRIPIDGPDDDPIPVMQLGEAEIAFENTGLWERLEPMAAAQFGDLNAIPQMAQLMIGQAFTEGGTRTPTAQEQAFVENVSSELARFLQEKNRIVVTSAPEGGVWLHEDLFDSPYDALATFQPVVSSTPIAYRALINTDELAAALGGGGGLDAAARLRIGNALLTGIGAPRSVSDGQALLQPLADQWNGEAAAMIAEALDETGNIAGAYAMALRAMAGGETSAIGLADSIEAEIPLADVLAAQEAARMAWPSVGDSQNEAAEIIVSGDVSAMRRRAYAASIGRGQPRDYAAAYYWASLAAAGGDRGAANLRRRLDERFGGRDGDAWQATAAAQASAALQTWTEGGLGATISERVR
jgi:hypothetical protein